jgi:hypothetical protein
MSRLEGQSGAISDLAPDTRNLLGQTNNQISPEKIERRRADDAEAVRNAQARISNTIGVIRSFNDQQPAPKLPRAANLRSPRRDVTDRLLTTSESPSVDHFAGFEARPPSSHGLESVPPRSEGLRRPIFGRLINRYASMVGFAAILAYGISLIAPFQSGASKTDSDYGGGVGQMPNGLVGDARPLLRLVTKNERAFANSPISLGVAVASPTDSGSPSLRGPAHGTRPSTGTGRRGDSWDFLPRYLGGVYIYAPPEFVGAMNAVIALISPSNKVIDSHPTRLEWMAKADSPELSSKQEIDSGTANDVSKMPIDSGPPSVDGKPQIDSGTASAAAIRTMDPEEAAALMERGRDLIRKGDVSLAQLAFLRVAEAGDADAALALAATYDPRYLAQHKLIGIVGDEAKARAWYQRASELGSIEADRILRRANKK